MSRAFRRCGAVLPLLLLPAVALAQEAARPRLGGGGAIDISLGRIIVSLIFCIIIAILAILLIRQRSGKMDLAALFARIEPRAGAIRVVETRRLSPHADICVVEHRETEYLLVVQQGSVQVLRECPVDEKPSA
ncbi:MAG: flagellar biosynthetic protein FliO [Candidatus Sphingomonas phytovorans]|nr:flagellar biosynthetic protein FliO [Sphingomonas sp.]WEJ98142.1 MAG: flagellar biosynthetic protein FliO [Sphingomonas sp.]